MPTSIGFGDCLIICGETSSFLDPLTTFVEKQSSIVLWRSCKTEILEESSGMFLTLVKLIVEPDIEGLSEETREWGRKTSNSAYKNSNMTKNIKH